MTRVLIADRHAIVRQGFRQILGVPGDLEVCGEAAGAAELLDQLQHDPIDVLVMELSLPGSGGVEFIRRLHQERPQLPILVFSAQTQGTVVSRAVRAGACGYVAKDSDPETLLHALHRVSRGEKFIDPALVNALVFEGQQDADRPHEVLSEREMQVFRMFAAGRTLAEIADTLHLSAKTVSTHKKRVMVKLNIDNNADLIRYALRYGLDKC